MDTYSIELFAYVIWMIYLILGCGFRFPELAKWFNNCANPPTGWLYFWEIVKAVLTWPWFKIDKLWEKYSKK